MASELAIAINKRIGANIRNQRQLAGYTMQGLGEALKEPKSGQQISKYELGIDRAAGVLLYEIAQLCGCSVSAFFDGIDDLLPGSDGNRPLDSEEGKVIRLMRQLPEDAQAAIADLVQAMARELAEKLKS